MTEPIRINMDDLSDADMIKFDIPGYNSGDEVYDELMQVVLRHWEHFTPNGEIARGVRRFNRQMERWVSEHEET